MYYCQPGKVADRFAEVMRERAKAGVRVLFLLDAFGSATLTEGLPPSRSRLLASRSRSSGPCNWYALEKAYARSHIRVVVVDGRIGYTGGFGMDDKWLGDGRHADQWRDTNVRFTGPAVQQLQATFATGWAEATGELLTGPDHVSRRLRRWQRARCARRCCTRRRRSAARPRSACSRCRSPRLDTRSTSRTRTSCLTMISFVCCAKPPRRGVDVRVLTPGKLNDVKSTWYAGRAQYERLLEGGVRIFWYQPAMIHAKAFVVDGCWASDRDDELRQPVARVQRRVEPARARRCVSARRCATCFSMTSRVRRK